MSIKGIAISSGVACGPVICFPPSLPLPIATDNHVSGYSSYEKARENALQYFNESLHLKMISLLYKKILYSATATS